MGQCPCRQGASGRQCSDCQPGQWGFPSCRPCQCNGHADGCNPQTGECQACRDYTDGQLCERCGNGFFGNPVLGSGDHCRHCPCPGNAESGHSNGHSCHADSSSNQILCNCKQGYIGIVPMIQFSSVARKSLLHLLAFNFSALSLTAFTLFSPP
uniref:Laminin EGF-like domain-containing protein n=1 Tax=Hucho hucho TaxID=62062 RepID=A0A4W5NYI1_9TELE